MDEQTIRLARACNLWNRLTDPRKFLSDARHATREARARRIMAHYLRPNLSRLREWSNGTYSVDFR